MNRIADLAVIGAGPAGCAAAICAADRRLDVILLEAGHYPRHKVCGEFVSAEAAEVLKYLLKGSGNILNEAPRINISRLHSGETSVNMRLSDPAYSIPRIKLDDCLWRAARTCGVDCRVETAQSVSRSDELFVVATPTGAVRARAVVNASGRWSRISSSGSTGEAWIGFKAHFSGASDDAVDLYFMTDGYCGVQAVAPGVLNACALVKQGSAKQLADVFSRHSALFSRARSWTQITDTFATAPVYLGLHSSVRDGVLQVGDAAGFVDPFVGDGISLALRSGVLAGRTVLDRSGQDYALLYSQAFAGVFRASRRIRSALGASNFNRSMLLNTVRIPAVARRIFHSTRASGFDVLGPSIP